MSVARLGYRSALFLACALACTHIAFLLYASYLGWSRFNAIAIYASAAAVIVVGLWVQSRIARYAGGIFCLISAAAAAWPAVSDGKPVLSLGLLWVISMGVISLVLGYLLLFSRTFASEFEHQRAIQPAYKGHLRTGVLLILGIAAAIATLIDILRLASL